MGDGLPARSCSGALRPVAVGGRPQKKGGTLASSTLASDHRTSDAGRNARQLARAQASSRLRPTPDGGQRRCSRPGCLDIARQAIDSYQTRNSRIMRTTTKSVFAGLAAAIILALAIGSATARRIEFMEPGFLIRWTNLAFIAGGFRVSCPVTLEGSFHSKTVSKVCGQLIGYISIAQIPVGEEPPCRGGTARALAERLPWHIQYNSFTGTLPTIRTIRLAIPNARFQILAGGITCLVGTMQSNPAFGDLAISASAINTLRALPEFGIPLGGEFLCTISGNGSLEGTGEVFTLVTPQARINIRLVQ